MPSDRERDLEAIQALGQTWTDAMKHSDIDRLLELVTEDAVFMPPNAPSIVGRPALAQAYRVVFAMFQVEQTFAPEAIQVGGGWAFVRGRDTLAMTPLAGGPSIEMNGRGISIMHRTEDGSWKFARGITNREAPLKGTAA